MKKLKFNITGMTCSSCSAHVEKAVGALDGVKIANVNLLSNSMVAEFDENKISNEDIIKAVIDAGYGASIDIEKGNKENGTREVKDKTEENIKSMKNRLIISACFLVPLMYVAMHHMFYEWFKLPVPEIIKSLFDGAENGVIFGFTQFLLLLPIIYVNRNYFIIGFKRLFKKSPNMDSLIAIGSFAATVYGVVAIYMMGYGLGHDRFDIAERYSMDIYFESSGTILTLITLR